MLEIMLEIIPHQAIFESNVCMIERQTFCNKQKTCQHFSTKTRFDNNMALFVNAVCVHFHDQNCVSFFIS